MSIRKAVPPPPTPPPPDYITADEASRMLRTHRTTVLRYVARGLLTGYRCGPKLIRLDRHEVERFMNRIG